MGEHKQKSSSSRHHPDGTKHSKDIHIGHSKPKDRKKGSSSDNVRWVCSYCNASNLSYNYDASCPFCFTVRDLGVSIYTLDGGSSYTESPRTTPHTRRDLVRAPSTNTYDSGSESIVPRMTTLDTSRDRAYASNIRTYASDRESIVQTRQNTSDWRLRTVTGRPVGQLNYDFVFETGPTMAPLAEPNNKAYLVPEPVTCPSDLPWITWRQTIPHIGFEKQSLLKSSQQVYATNISIPRHLDLPGNTEYAEQLIRLIANYAAGINTASNNLNPMAYGLSGHKTTNKTFRWVLLLGMARSFIFQRRNDLGFTLLNLCFNTLKAILEPNIWLIFVLFYGTFSLARNGYKPVAYLIDYIYRLAKANSQVSPHPFRDLFTIINQIGPSTLLELCRSFIMRCFLGILSRQFLDKSMALTILQKLGFGEDNPVIVYSFPAPHFAVEKAFIHVTNMEGTLFIRPESGDQQYSKLAAAMSLPKSPMELYCFGSDMGFRPLPASSPTLDGDNKEKPHSRPQQDSSVLNELFRQFPIEMHSEHLSVTARLEDLAICFDPVVDISEVDEVSPAYFGLRSLLYQSHNTGSLTDAKSGARMIEVSEKAMQDPFTHIGSPIPATGQTEPVAYHLFKDKYLKDIEANVPQFLLLLPEDIRLYLRLETVLGQACWTCILPDTTVSYTVPLTIANLPVVVPVRAYYPLNPGLMPPPDPHPRHISPLKELQHDTLEHILDTFEEATGLYLLVNGMLQMIVPEDFDVSSAMNQYPVRFGGLQVSYIPVSQIPTAGEVNKGKKASTTGWTQVFNQTHNAFQSITAATPSGSGYSNPTSNSARPVAEQSLSIGSSVRAQVNNTKFKNRSQAKLGLMTKAQNRAYITLPTHLVTAALTDSNLGWKWPQSGFQDVKLVAGNDNVMLGTIAKTFDPDAKVFPDGFEHDVSLVDVTNLPEAVTLGMKPCVPLEWFSDQEWANLQFNTKNLFLLDDKDRTAKSIGIQIHQFQMVGQGILVNRQKLKPWSIRKPFGKDKNKQGLEAELEECKRLVARSILYRVAHDYEAPGGQSGTPVCLLDSSEPGTQKGKVAGFTSYVQMVQDIQHYHVEGDQLADMLHEGRVAFYGAFKVPREMREEHSII